MAALGDHPYIVQIFRGGTSADGRPYLVMKYYPPPNLARRARLKPLTVDEVLRTGIQLASAVETAHQAGHRPPRHQAGQRARQQPSATPSLTDFGIAGRGADTSALSRPPSGDARESAEVGRLGPGAPPEVLYVQNEGTPALAERGDVYSLAATLWQLLVGRSPFEVPGGDNSAYVLMPRIRTQPVPSTGRPDVPPSLERILAQSMAKILRSARAAPWSWPACSRASSRTCTSPAPRSSSSTTAAGPRPRSRPPTGPTRRGSRACSRSTPRSSGVCAPPALPPPALPPSLRPPPASSPPPVRSLRQRDPSSTSAPWSPVRVSRRRPTGDRW